MSEFHARLVSSAAEIGRAAWNACANPGGDVSPHPFTQYDFFAALEESGSATAATVTAVAGGCVVHFWGKIVEWLDGPHTS